MLEKRIVEYFRLVKGHAIGQILTKWLCSKRLNDKMRMPHNRYGRYDEGF